LSLFTDMTGLRKLKCRLRFWWSVWISRSLICISRWGGDDFVTFRLASILIFLGYHRNIRSNIHKAAKLETKILLGPLNSKIPVWSDALIWSDALPTFNDYLSHQEVRAVECILRLHLILLLSARRCVDTLKCTAICMCAHVYPCAYVFVTYI